MGNPRSSFIFSNLKELFREFFGGEGGIWVSIIIISPKISSFDLCLERFRYSFIALDQSTFFEFPFFSHYFLKNHKSRILRNWNRLWSCDSQTYFCWLFLLVVALKKTRVEQSGIRSSPRSGRNRQRVNSQEGGIVIRNRYDCSDKNSRIDGNSIESSRLDKSTCWKISFDYHGNIVILFAQLLSDMIP